MPFSSCTPRLPWRTMAGAAFVNVGLTANDNNTVRTVNDAAVVKTIYDPCPVGYHVPASGAFTGFTKDGANQYNASANWNVNGSFNAGWNFYTNGWKAGNTIYIPAAGYRHLSTGGAINVGGIGFYWSAVPNDDTFGWDLYLDSNFVYPQNYNNRSFGFPVRAVREN